MTLAEQLKEQAEEFRIYAAAECLPESARWIEWAEACEAAAAALETKPLCTTN